MLNLLPTPELESNPRPYAEAVSRLASIRHALRLVDRFGGGPAPDPEGDERIADAWDDAGEARQRWFDSRSAMTVGATAAGLEALLVIHRNDDEPHQEAGRVLVGGLDLLVHQAALQFELFTGLTAPLEEMRAAGEEALARRSVS